MNKKEFNKKHLSILNKLKDKKGFTLVESMVSIAILTIALSTFAVFLTTTNKMTMLTIQNEKDCQILQEIIATGDTSKYEGTAIRALDGDASITIIIDKNTIVNPDPNKPDPNIKMKGKYVAIENTKTGQHYVIFLGE